MSKELLVEVTIPMYIREYIKSNSIRPKYYKPGDKIPKKYWDNLDKYKWKSFSKTEMGKKVKQDYLVEAATGERVIANPHLVGQQSRININGQGIYNGAIQEFDRANMIGQIKDHFRPYIKTLKPINRFPLRLDVFLFDTIHDDFVNGQDWDVDNRFFPYGKTFQDMLSEVGTEEGNVPNKLYNPRIWGDILRKPIIPDDHRMYITEPPHAVFVPVPDVEDRKLVIRIYKDNRPIVLNNFLYQKFHGDKLK